MSLPIKANQNHGGGQNLKDMVLELTPEQQMAYIKEVAGVDEEQNQESNRSKFQGPCPECGGDDRYGVFFNEQEGKAFYNCHCCSGDIFGAAAQYDGATEGFVSQCKAILDHFDIPYDGPAAKPKPLTLDESIRLWCKEKRIPNPDWFIETFEPKHNRHYSTDSVPAFSVDVCDHEGKVIKTQTHAPSRHPNDKLPKGVTKSLFEGIKGGITLNGKPEEGQRWFVVEGIKDGSAIAHVFDGKANVACLVGAKGWFKEAHAEMFRGCDLVFVPDLDEPSVATMKQIYGFCQLVANTMRFARLDGELKERNGEGVRECIRKDGVDRVRHILEYAPEVKPHLHFATVNSGRVRIEIQNDNLHQQVELTSKALRDACDRDFLNGVFVNMENRLCYLDTSGNPKIVGISSKATLAAKLSSFAQFFRTKKDGEESVQSVPSQVAETLLNDSMFRGELPKIKAISSAPIVLPSGEIATTKSYNRSSEVIVWPVSDIELPENVSKDDAKAALTRLEDLFADFNFGTCDEDADCHRSSAIALILSLLTQYKSGGNRNVPLTFFDADDSGAGKSLVSGLCFSIGQGVDTGASNCPDNDEELEKRITSLLSSGLRSYNLDNVPNRKAFGSAILDSFLTKSKHVSRILGTNSAGSVIEAEANIVMIASGNNTRFSGDLKRRLMICRIRKTAGKRSYKHTWLTNHSSHPEKIAAATRDALIILKGFHQAGSPKDDTQRLDSFEIWHDDCVSPLLWLGAASPYGSRRSIETRDATTEGRIAAVLGLAALFRFKKWKKQQTVNAISSALSDCYAAINRGESVLYGDDVTLTEDERTAIRSLGENVSKNGKIEPAWLRNELQDNNGRNESGFCIHSATQSNGKNKKIAYWSVIKYDDLNSRRKPIASYSDVHEAIYGTEEEVIGLRKEIDEQEF